MSAARACRRRVITSRAKPKVRCYCKRSPEPDDRYSFILCKNPEKCCPIRTRINKSTKEHARDVTNRDNETQFVVPPASPMLSPETLDAVENAERLVQDAHRQIACISSIPLHKYVQQSDPGYPNLDDEKDEQYYIRELVASKFHQLNAGSEKKNDENKTNRRYCKLQEQSINRDTSPVSPKTGTSVRGLQRKTRLQKPNVKDKTTRQRERDVKDRFHLSRDKSTRSARKLNGFQIQEGPAVNVERKLVTQNIENIHILPDPSFTPNRKNVKIFEFRHGSSMNEIDDEPTPKEVDFNSKKISFNDDNVNRVRSVFEEYSRNKTNEQKIHKSTETQSTDDKATVTKNVTNKSVQFTRKTFSAASIENKGRPTTEFMETDLENENDESRERENVQNVVNNSNESKNSVTLKTQNCTSSDIQNAAVQVSAEVLKAEEESKRERDLERVKYFEAIDRHFADIRKKNRDNEYLFTEDSINHISLDNLCVDDDIIDLDEIQLERPQIDDLDAVLSIYDKTIERVNRVTESLTKKLSFQKFAEYDCLNEITSKPKNSDFRFLNQKLNSNSTISNKPADANSDFTVTKKKFDTRNGEYKCSIEMDSESEEKEEKSLDLNIILNKIHETEQEGAIKRKDTKSDFINEKDLRLFKSIIDKLGVSSDSETNPIFEEFDEAMKSSARKSLRNDDDSNFEMQRLKSDKGETQISEINYPDHLESLDKFAAWLFRDEKSKEKEMMGALKETALTPSVVWKFLNMQRKSNSKASFYDVIGSLKTFVDSYSRFQLPPHDDSKSLVSYNTKVSTTKKPSEGQSENGKHEEACKVVKENKENVEFDSNSKACALTNDVENKQIDEYKQKSDNINKNVEVKERLDENLKHLHAETNSVEIANNENDEQIIEFQATRMPVIYENFQKKKTSGNEKSEKSSREISRTKNDHSDSNVRYISREGIILEKDTSTVTDTFTQVSSTADSLKDCASLRTSDSYSGSKDQEESIKNDRSIASTQTNGLVQNPKEKIVLISVEISPRVKEPTKNSTEKNVVECTKNSAEKSMKESVKNSIEKSVKELTKNSGEKSAAEFTKRSTENSLDDPTKNLSIEDLPSDHTTKMNKNIPESKTENSVGTVVEKSVKNTATGTKRDFSANAMNCATKFVKNIVETLIAETANDAAVESMKRSIRSELVYRDLSKSIDDQITSMTSSLRDSKEGSNKCALFDTQNLSEARKEREISDSSRSLKICDKNNSIVKDQKKESPTNSSKTNTKTEILTDTSNSEGEIRIGSSCSYSLGEIRLSKKNALGANKITSDKGVLPYNEWSAIASSDDATSFAVGSSGEILYSSD